MKEKLVFRLCVGLPGSGKTYYLKNSYSPSDSHHYIDCDMFHSIKELKTVIKEYSQNYCQSFRIYRDSRPVSFDCLITTNDFLNEIIDIIFKSAEKEYVSDKISLEIHFWKENRKLCLFNDRGRRVKSSKLSIENLPLEYPVVKNKEISFNIIEHDVIAAPGLNAYFDQYKDSYSNEFIMTSSSWCTGGTFGNCWNDRLGTLTPETPLKSFEKFDKLLEELCPDINFLTYKKLYDECVTVEETSESDYYGGVEYRQYYKCDLEKLYKMLVELNIIQS